VALEHHRIPLALKIGYTVFVCVLVPAYAMHHGWANFLWFSNVALLLTWAAIWLENRWIISMQAVSVSLLELVWIGDFGLHLLLGESPTGLTAYMGKPDHPLFIRALSLYHIVLPFLLMWLVCRLGYEPRAWIAQTCLAWIVLPIIYVFTDPQRSINWVFGPGDEQTWMPMPWWFALVMLAFPLGVYLPTHLALQKLVRQFGGV